MFLACKNFPSNCAKFIRDSFAYKRTPKMQARIFLWNGQLQWIHKTGHEFANWQMSYYAKCLTT